MRVPNDTPLRVVQPKPNDDDDDVAVEGHKPHIPTGAYLARYLGHETAFLFAKAQKIFLRFEICEGAHQGVRLVRPYRVRRIVGKPGPGGKFILAAGSDMYRMLARVLDVRNRPDRISLRPLKHMLLMIHVRTVEKDRDNTALTESTQYSVVDDIHDGNR